MPARWMAHFLVEPHQAAEATRWLEPHERSQLWGIRTVIDAISDASFLEHSMQRVKMAHIVSLITEDEFRAQVESALGPPPYSSDTFDRLYSVRFLGGFSPAIVDELPLYVSKAIADLLDSSAPAAISLAEEIRQTIPTAEQRLAADAAARTMAAREVNRAIWLRFPFHADRTASYVKPLIAGTGAGDVYIDWLESDCGEHRFSFTVRAPIEPHQRRPKRISFGEIEVSFFRDIGNGVSSMISKPQTVRVIDHVSTTILLQ